MQYKPKRNKQGKGYTHSKTIPFIKLEKSLITSNKFRALKPTSKCLLVELLAQYNGFNNGDLCAPKGYCKNWHISDKTLYRGLEELLTKGFIIKTRQGKIANGGLDCNLFALTWKQIDHCDGIELDSSYIKRIYTPLNKLINDTG